MSWVRSITLHLKIKLMKLSQDLKSFKLYLYGEKKINEHRIFSCVDLALYYIGQEWELSKFDLQIQQSVICISARLCSMSQVNPLHSPAPGVAGWAGGSRRTYTLQAVPSELSGQFCPHMVG